MSEPQNLQHRLAMAFHETPSVPVEEGVDNLYLQVDHPNLRLPHPLDPDPEEFVEPELHSDRHSMLRYWLAGGGLVASALTLSMSTGSGFVVIAICLAAAAVGTILYSFAARLERGATPAAEPLDLKPAAPADVAVETQSYAAAGAMLGSIHDALGDITVCRSLKGTILSANQTFRDAMRTANPEGKTCEELGIRFQPRPVEHCYDVEIATARGPRTYLWHDIVTRDPVLGDLVVQSIARDVTAERQHAQAREEARARAEEASGLKSQLIATVSHEIRTPLSGLLGMGHLLAGTTLSPEQKNYLDGISQSGTALVQLVEDLLDFSTLSAGRFQLKPRKEAVRPMIESVVELLSSRAHAKGIEIGATIAPQLPEMLFLDPARLRQVLYNVIGNAVKFTESGGVLVSAALEGPALVVRVRDSGPGMNEAEMQRIFGEFEQGELSRAREGGVGLGLAISARIMAEAGGALSVESQPGHGSTFIVRLPVSADASGLRHGRELFGTRVLLMAPVGAAATALATTLKALGAETSIASTAEDAQSILVVRERFTDIIVDHRLDAEFTAGLSHNPRLAGAKRIYLVNPESRPAQMSGNDYDSWLIRPLREQSLIDVLTGRLSGLEHRPAASEEFPVISAEPDDTRDNAEPAATNPAGLSILLGEDDPVNAMISQAILEKAGHNVRLATSFAKLTEALAEATPDIILTDNHMPDGSSDAFIAQLRDIEQNTQSKPMPVIVVTADTSDETRRRLLKTGADLVLHKPAGPDVIKNAILRVGERLICAA
jgi:signal transduction histidine kinase/CheY-like chemotaxis protein